jgi:hypothetical protein
VVRRTVPGTRSRAGAPISLDGDLPRTRALMLT